MYTVVSAQINKLKFLSKNIDGCSLLYKSFGFYIWHDKIITGTINFPDLFSNTIHVLKKLKNVTFQFYISKNQDSKFLLWSATVKVSKKLAM